MRSIIYWSLSGRLWANTPAVVEGVWNFILSLYFFLMLVLEFERWKLGWLIGCNLKTKTGGMQNGKIQATTKKKKLQKEQTLKDESNANIEVSAEVQSPQRERCWSTTNSMWEWDACSALPDQDWEGTTNSPKIHLMQHQETNVRILSTLLFWYFLTNKCLYLYHTKGEPQRVFFTSCWTR